MSSSHPLVARGKYLTVLLVICFIRLRNVNLDHLWDIYATISDLIYDNTYIKNAISRCRKYWCQCKRHSVPTCFLLSHYFGKRKSWIIFVAVCIAVHCPHSGDQRIKSKNAIFHTTIIETEGAGKRRIWINMKATLLTKVIYI